MCSPQLKIHKKKLEEINWSSGFPDKFKSNVD